jgi:uncharacterized protein (DUF433 family)
MYPYITNEQIAAALRFAAWRSEEEELSVEQQTA